MDWLLHSHSLKQVFKGIIMPQALVFLYIFIEDLGKSDPPKGFKKY